MSNRSHSHSPTLSRIPSARERKKKKSSLGTSKGILEIAKFGIYVTVPIVLMYSFANNTNNLQKFMGNRSYIVFPSNTVRPPSPEEMRERARALGRRKDIH
eukprot:XP_024462799.1 uncharacterized protein LOC18101576 [Populus trichocarpa]